MKRNLNSNKAMAIGLAVTLLGSSVSTYAANALNENEEKIEQEILSNKDVTEEVSSEKSVTLADKKPALTAGQKLCLVDTKNNNNRYLFEIANNPEMSELGAIFLGKVSEADFNALADKDDYNEGLWGYDSGYAAYNLVDKIVWDNPDEYQLFEIFQAGNGTEALKGDTYSVEEINYILPFAITIKENAFKDKTITNDANKEINLNYLQGIEANGFAISSTNPITIFGIDLDPTKTEDTAFGSNATITLNVNKGASSDFETKFSSNNNITIGIINFISLVNNQNKIEISGKAGEDITLTLDFETNLTTSFEVDDTVDVILPEDFPEGITVKSAKISTASTAGTAPAYNTFSVELTMATEAGKSINTTDTKLGFEFDKDKITGATINFLSEIKADINVVDAKATVTGNIEADAGEAFTDKTITVTLFDELDSSVAVDTDVKDWITNELPENSNLTVTVGSITEANKGSVKAWNVEIKVSGEIGDVTMAEEFTEPIKLTIPSNKFATPLAEDLVIEGTADNGKFNITPAVSVGSGITAGGYKFKVLTKETSSNTGTIALIGKNDARNYEHSANLTETNGYVEKVSLKGVDYTVTQIGDDAKSLTGSISTEDINKFGKTVTLIGENALQNVTLNTDNGSVLKLDAVTEVKANGLAFNATGVKVHLEAVTTADKIDANAFGTSTVAELTVKASLKADIENKISATNKNVTTTAAADTINISDVTINGGVNTAIKEQEIILTLGSSELYNNISAVKSVDDAVTTWLVDAPSGITAKIKKFDRDNLAIILTIGGTPTATSDAIIKVTISQADINGATADVVATVNENAKYNILPTLAVDDEITAGEYKFKVLELAADENTNGKVALIEKVVTRASYSDATLNETNGYVESITLGNDVFTPGKYEVTQIGDGTTSLIGSITTEDINKFGNTVTKISENALKDVQLDTTNSKAIRLSKVTEIGANALAFTTNDTVSLYLEGVTDANSFTNAFGATTKVTLNLNSDIAAAVAENLSSNRNITVVATTNEIKINDVTIDGKKNTKIQDKDIVITLGNGSLFTELKASKNVGDDVTAAINVPNGLTAKIKSFNDNENTVTITISGTPTATSTEVITINGAELGLTSDNSFARNDKAKFNITAATTNGGGSSSSGGGSSSSGGSGAIINSTGQLQSTTTEASTETTTQYVTKNLSLDKVSLPAISQASKSFSDVAASHWASSAISKLSSAGIITGMPDGSFNINGNTKRADMAVMLIRLLGLNETFSGNFSDVPETAYYANAVGLAREYGIVTGSTDGRFNPNQNISRQDTMVMIARILQNLKINVNADTSVLAKFSDNANISQYALEGVAILVNAGVVNGNNGNINPKAPITRAEIAVIMDKLYDIIEEGKKASVETTTETTTETTSKSTTSESTTSEGSTETTTETTTA